MNEVSGSNDHLVISYLTLRRALGVLGIGLPFVLAIGGAVFFATGLQESISDYYYTGMGDVFVGIMVAIGLFLASYTGHKNTGQNDPLLSDNVAGNIASVGAVGLAIFPTAPGPATDTIARIIGIAMFPAAPDPDSIAAIVGIAHFAFAAVFFLTLAYISYFLFTRSDPDKEPTPQKLKRNRVYRACAIAILAALVLIAAAKLVLPESMVDGLKLVFWLEAIAVVAFGTSWLIKGETLLSDPA